MCEHSGNSWVFCGSVAVQAMLFVGEMQEKVVAFLANYRSNSCFEVRFLDKLMRKVVVASLRSLDMGACARQAVWARQVVLERRVVSLMYIVVLLVMLVLEQERRVHLRLL